MAKTPLTSGRGTRGCSLLAAGLLLVISAGCDTGPAATVGQRGEQLTQAEAVSFCEGCDAGELIDRLGLEEAPTPVRERPGWSRPRRIVVLGSETAVGWMQSAVPGVELIAASDMGTALRAVADADALIGSCSPRLVEAGTRLKWVQLPSAGAERCVTISAIRERGILVTNAQRLYGPEIAEHVMAMLLAFSRGLYRYIPAQSDGSWSRGLVPRDAMWELEHKTILIVGLGGIGTEVAWRADALGMRVTATRRSSRSGPPFVDYVGLAHELHDLAGQADVVVNAAPLTPETTGLFDADFFRTMKPTAYFINVGRGRSVVTEDLVAALESSAIAGAGLDVTDPEPLPADHVLWRLPNVIITPHVAGRSDRGRLRLWTLFRENLRRYVAGGRMLSVVDVERGY